MFGKDILVLVNAMIAIVPLLLMLPINALAQTNDNYTKAFENFSKIMGKVASTITNLHNTVTVEQCTKARQLYPTSHNVTAFGNTSFNPLDIALHACKEAGK